MSISTFLKTFCETWVSGFSTTGIFTVDVAVFTDSSANDMKEELFRNNMQEQILTGLI